MSKPINKPTTGAGEQSSASNLIKVKVLPNNTYSCRKSFKLENGKEATKDFYYRAGDILEVPPSELVRVPHCLIALDAANQADDAQAEIQKNNEERFASLKRNSMESAKQVQQSREIMQQRIAEQASKK